MRASKRAARREVQKHIDFTEGHLAKKHSIKGLSESNFRAAAFIRGKKRPRTQSRRSRNFTVDCRDPCFFLLFVFFLFAFVVFFTFAFFYAPRGGNQAGLKHFYKNKSIKGSEAESYRPSAKRTWQPSCPLFCPWPWRAQTVSRISLTCGPT